LTSAAIVVSQLATIAAALLVTRADLIGRKPLLLLGCAALPVRGLLYVLSTDSWAVAMGQVLDGVGGGLIDALLPLVLADIMRGSGHYSAARGLVGFVQGIGGSLAQLVAGILVVRVGYASTFAVLAMLALLPFALVALALPETGPKRSGLQPKA
jgi:MFS family permease